MISILIGGGMYLPDPEYNISSECKRDVEAFQHQLLREKPSLKTSKHHSFLPEDVWALQSKLKLTKTFLHFV